MRKGEPNTIGGLAERLKESRERMHLTRQQVAERLTISVSTLADYEISHRQPSLPVLKSLSEIYGVSTDYLLGKNTTQIFDTNGLSDNQIDAVKHIIDVMKHG